MPLTIGIVVGEPSGDKLAAGLISAIRERDQDIEVYGVVGPKLIEQGAVQLHNMDILSVMGLIEPLKRLPELLKLRAWLVDYFISTPPDIFIGVDAPDFNLRLEKKLRNAGIPVVHYVSPSVWAWRQSRLKLIKQACDLMLTLFPFEAKFYQQQQIPVEFVGHPAADKIPLQVDIAKAREALNLSLDKNIIGILPGSRYSELQHMLPIYLETMLKLLSSKPNLRFVMPVISQEHADFITEIQQDRDIKLPLTIVVNNSYQAIAASDIVLVTSGTATLEVMLHKKPMIIAYRTNLFTYWIAKMLIKVPYIGLPNLLAEEIVAPEYIQGAVNSTQLSAALLDLLTDQNLQDMQQARYTRIHHILKQNANKKASQRVLNLLEEL